LLLSPLSPSPFNQEETTNDSILNNPKNNGFEADKSVENPPKIKIIEDNLDSSGLL